MLSVSHLQQRSQSDCLPICAQMVLPSVGISSSYQALLKLLETRTFGTPFRNLRNLQALGVKVNLKEIAIEEFEPFLNSGLPIIASINTADLGYWSTEVDHAVVVAGIDRTAIFIHDPSLKQGPTAVSHTEFALAQLKFDHLCAIISR